MPPATISVTPRRILVTGGTGYLGLALIPSLLARGHCVRALARPLSLAKVPAGAEAMPGDPLNGDDVTSALAGIDTIVHLVGVPKPSPGKAPQFRTVDLASIHTLAEAIALRGERPHVVYVSVAQPAPVMRAYVAVRAEAESVLRALGVPATFLRPWYVLGPGHRWPCVLVPLYGILHRLPPTRATAGRLGLVTRAQMIAALVSATEDPPPGTRIIDVPTIKAAGLRALAAA